MKICFKLFFLFILYFSRVSAQDTLKITGTVSNPLAEKLAGASVLLYDKDSGNILSFAVSDDKGKYLISYPSRSKIYYLKVNMLGYESQAKSVVIKDSYNLVENFILQSSHKILDSIVIKDERSVKFRKDTLEYIADSFKTVNTRKIGDLLKSIDGFSVDNNGKITYRGREISALLFNGDDIGGNLYGLISKNLTSDIVEKIQVFENYQKNRILSQVIKSDDVAVNLKLKKNITGNLNGSASIGLSPRGKGALDYNAIYYKPSFQYIQIFNANTIGNYAGSSLSSENTEIKKKGILSEPAQHLYNIATPSLPQNYIYNNRDIVVAPFLNFRINGGQKIKMRFAGFTGFEKRNSNFFIREIINEQKKWEIDRAQEMNLNSKWVRGDLEWIFDNGKRMAGNLKVNTFYPKTNSNFEEISSIAFNDTLWDKANNYQKLFDITFNTAYRVGTGKVLKLNSSILTSRQQTFSNFYTIRFNGFFGLLGEQEYEQRLENKSKIYLFDLDFLQNIEGSQFNAGIKLRRNDYFILQNIQLAGNSNLFSINRNVIGNKFSFYGSVNKNLSLKSSIQLYVNPGISNMYVSNKISTSILDYNVALDYTYKYKPFSSFSLSFKTNQELSDFKYFTNDSLLTSRAIYVSSRVIRPINYIGFESGVNKFNLLRNMSFSFSGWIKVYGMDYLPAINGKPEYSLITYTPVENEMEFGLTSSLRSYVPFIKSTLGFTAFFQKNFSDEVLNDQVVNNRYSNFSFIFNYISQFKLPIKFEVNPVLNYSAINQFSKDGTNLKFENLSFITKIALTYQVNPEFYAGFLLKWYAQGINNFLVSDFNSKYIINKKWSADLVILNLFNNRSFNYKQIGSYFTSTSKYQIINRTAIFSINYSF